ncbi:MAG: M20/M25/M40 family metallo-hydrolase, partial [Acidobacteria bacterium]|nr:M20/M25/M40 family metallo-hydrolase [Acidobacteriota bacterium]
MTRIPGRGFAAGTAACVSAFLLSISACAAPPPGGFSVANGRAHVRMLGGTIGIRPAGTDANRRAREYFVSALARTGFEVHVQETDAVRPELGRTVHVFNIVAVSAGRQPDAVALVSHYDSVPAGPGAADAGLGVAVCLEAGRVLAAQSDRTHSLVVALTDGEEAGLMGAAALIQDPVWQRVGAYLNLEAVGTTGPSALFESGPGNPWLVKAWARSAPGPFGASYAAEIYKRMPNDSDFSILKRTGIPGLNFAPIGNSYAYHTHLDTPDGLSDDTIRQTGEGVVAIVRTLEREDLSRRSTDWTLYFDINGIGAVASGSWLAGVLGGLGLVTGLAAFVRLLPAVRRRTGL